MRKAEPGEQSDRSGAQDDRALSAVTAPRATPCTATLRGSIKTRSAFGYARRNLELVRFREGDVVREPAGSLAAEKLHRLAELGSAGPMQWKWGSARSPTRV